MAMVFAADPTPIWAAPAMMDKKFWIALLSLRVTSYHDSRPTPVRVWMLNRKK
jgi:hypothetical protein